MFLRRQISITETSGQLYASLQIFRFPVDPSAEARTRRPTERFLAEVGAIVGFVGYGRVAVAGPGPVVMANVGE